MKTLFSVISVLAVIYLAMQTQVLQEWSSKALLFATDHKNRQVPNMLKPDALEPEELKPELLEQVALLQVHNEQLQSKVADLETQMNSLISKNIQSVKLKATALDKGDVEIEQTNTIDDEISTNKDIQIESLSMDSKFREEQQSDREVVSTHFFNKTSNATSEQQKRVQQQAILRELSNRMELSALSSLSQ